MEQKTLARWLKLILIGVGLCGAVVYLAVLPAYGQSLVRAYPEFAGRFWPWLIFLWISGIPCYAVLVFGWKIAANIGRDRSFSYENAACLKRAAWLAAGDGAFFFAGNIALLFADQSHPGVVLCSLLVVFAGAAAAVVFGGLSHLVRKAAALQELNELTI